MPTTDRNLPNPDPESAEQIAVMAQNAKDFGIEYFDEFDKRQGIVHIIGPEQGFTLPGTTIVCGDSHTATHGAFGALAYGIGTSEVEHVLATQTLIQKKSKNMRAVVDGKLPPGVTAKDIILAIIGEIGTAGGTGYALEYAGEAIRALSMEGRMTVCNMSIEGGAKAGFIAPDEKTYDYLKDRPKAPRARPGTRPCAIGRRCAPTTARISTARSGSMPPSCRRSSPGAPAPSRWSRSPAACRCRPRSPTRTSAAPPRRSLGYMGLKGGEKITDIELDRVFIGSCTNGAHRGFARGRARWSDGKTVNANVNAMIVPGSGLVKEQAEAEGLDKIFVRPPASTGASRAARCASR